MLDNDLIIFSPCELIGNKLSDERLASPLVQSPSIRGSFRERQTTDSHICISCGISISMINGLVCPLIELEQYNVNNISKKEYMEAHQ